MTNATAGLCMNCFSPLGEYLVCPGCGHDSSAPPNPDCRKPGSVVGQRYLVGRLVRRNGESAVYTALDNNLKKRVFLREYYPGAIAMRQPSTGDVMTKPALGAQYKALMSGFVDTCNEIRRMSLTEPVVPIEDVVSGHGTVFAVYKDLSLMPFEQWLQRQGGKITAAEARALLFPILNCLSNLHAHGVIHRGVSPQTVYIDQNSKLYLWDFCQSAARTAGSELEAELFNGYSAPEQYSTTGWQGTWTDVYGAAALFYRAVSGFVPPKSTMIGAQRPLAPLIDLVMELPVNISDAVAEAMDTSAETRTQQIGVFVSRLMQTELSSTAIYDVGKVTGARLAQKESNMRKKNKRRQGKYIALGLLITGVVLAIVFYVVMTTYFPHILPSDNPPPSESVSSLDSPDEPEEEIPDSDQGMPSLIGQKAADVLADPAYTGRFAFVERPEFHDTAEEGMIYDQSPAAGITVPDGRTVILYVSKGKQMLVMPDLSGKTREEVDAAIRQLQEEAEVDLTYGAYDRYSEGAEPGTVVNTTPAPGTEFEPKNTRINVWFMPEDVKTVGEAVRVERESSTQSASSRPSNSVSSRRDRDGPDVPPKRN